MKVEFFIAKRILLGRSHEKSFTKPVINIAVWGIALGVLIMIMSVAITKGFQKEIKGKIVGFASDIQISDAGISESYESNPILFDSTLYQKLKASPKVKHVQIYASKAGIIKTQENMQGVILKGIAPDFNWDFFKQHLIEGDTLSIKPGTICKEAMISSKIASTLNLKLGDKFRVFFIIKEVVEGREKFSQKKYAFTIKGMYKTGLSEEFDSKFIFIDLKRIKKLNKWEDGTIGGYEVFLTEDNLLTSIKNSGQSSYEYYLEKEIGLIDDFFLELSFLDVRSIYSRYPQIVSWLEYIDMHILIILVIILVVAVVNMSSSLLILILEKTNMIGILKSLGASNVSIRKIFVLKAAFLIAKGTLIGNILALTLCYLQINFEVLKLDAGIYYLDSVPVYLNLWHVVGINILTIVVSSVMLIIPSVFISYISPVKAIKFN
ncbi:MAG: lipoprotein-releasing system permease protein [Saprospiraceae bacterium]